MPTLHRFRTDRGESITLVARDYSVTVEVTTRNLELDATTMERLLLAPLSVLAQEAREIL